MIKTAVNECLGNGIKVGHAHLKYLNPFPKNLGEVLSRFDKVIIPEMNNGQLIKIIRDQYLIDAQALNKIKGVPFTTNEIVEAIEQKMTVA